MVPDLVTVMLWYSMGYLYVGVNKEVFFVVESFQTIIVV